MRAAAGSASHIGAAVHDIEDDDLAPPEVARPGIDHLRIVLRTGAEDPAARRTDVIFDVLLYPGIGGVLSAIAFHRDLLPLLFPLMSGFALLGPIAAIGPYEMSRRRARGEPAGFGTAFGVVGAPAMGPIVTIGLGLVLSHPVLAGTGSHASASTRSSDFCPPSLAA